MCAAQKPNCKKLVILETEVYVGTFIFISRVCVMYIVYVCVFNVWLCGWHGHICRLVDFPRGVSFK